MDHRVMYIVFQMGHRVMYIVFQMDHRVMCIVSDGPQSDVLCFRWTTVMHICFRWTTE